MVKWQKAFLVFGSICLIILFLFPPQVVSRKHVEYLFVTSGFPIDWFQFIFIALIIIIITGLGIVVNREGKHE